MTTRVLGARDLAKKAALLRASAAEDLISAGRWTSRGSDNHCHFELYGDALPLEGDAGAVAFNRAVTTHALREVLRSHDPAEVAFLGSRVVEETFQVIYRRGRFDEPLKNLSVAKHFGTFFTSQKIAQQMIAEIPFRRNSRSLLDPCVGSGALLCASLLSKDRDRYQEHAGIELDGQLARWARQIIHRVAVLTKYTGKIRIGTGDGLNYLLSQRHIQRASTTDIVINPPYGRLRVTNALASNAETKLRKNPQVLQNIQSIVLDQAQLLRAHSMFSEEKGMLEKSRLFFRACAEWAANGSSVAIISPDSWMSAVDGIALRRVLLEKRLLRKVLLISEGDGDFKTVNQATAITMLRKADSSHYELAKLNGSVIPLGKIDYSTNKQSEDNALPRLRGVEYRLYRRLSETKKFSDQAWIVNARGEVDQTLQKSLFRVRKTAVPLIRGEHVTRFGVSHFSDTKKPSFIDPDGFRSFIGGKPKREHFKSPRIVGRQCSYARQKRRLIFGELDAHVAVGNSCNYIVIRAESKEQERRCRALLLGLLNSAVLDWCFRARNSNNHVGNYEIDAFPFPTQQQWFGLVASLTRMVMNFPERSSKGWLLDLLEAAVFLSYGVTSEEEINAVLDEVEVSDRHRTMNFVQQLSRGARLEFPGEFEGFFNHKAPTLSALDMEMIMHVPEGGNWQNIPASVPSRRLDQIRKMAADRGVVRTTYYGRLRQEQPAYTISTYFNRPGNGTHIHPTQNRTLTCREAARLQSFPDSYIFLGPEGAVRNQIGNAVPPLLGRAVGERLLDGRSSGICVDVFCGAGGLSLGLEKAGWKVLAAIDNDSAALDTYALNRPTQVEAYSPTEQKTAVYRRDLHKSGDFNDCIERIRKGLQGRQLDLLAGGPPCQGFSHAGFRQHSDDRNDLAAIYLNFAEKLRPRIFLLENVEGLATYKDGAVLRDIVETLKMLGYRVQSPVWNLCAEQFGVPQMRRRVFVVATTDDTLSLAAPVANFQRCGGRRGDLVADCQRVPLKKYYTVADALAGLSLPPRESELVRWLES